MRVGLGSLLCLLFVARFSNADDQTVEIVGAAECADCQRNNFKTSQAFSGLHVTIDCKLKTGEIKRVGDGELDEGGEFKISLLKEIIKDNKNLKKKCYAQLHNAAAAPCPAHDGLDNTKIVIKSETHDKITFTPTKTLRFSTALCTSKFLWPFFEYPPLPKLDPWKKKWPKFTIPPLKNFGQPWILPPPYKPKPEPPVFKPLPPPVPFYKPIPKPPIVKPIPPVYKPIPKPPIVKPLPPVVKPIPPIYKPIPKPPIVKPLPPIYKPIPKPPVVKPLPPIYKPIPKPPVVKPFPPAVPIYKPLPPPVPIYEPPVVKPLPPPVPIYEPPVVTKPLPPPFPLFPLPPLPPLPPLHKKPCPPITKILPKLKHPKFGYFPKLPPFNSNP